MRKNKNLFLVIIIAFLVLFAAMSGIKENETENEVTSNVPVTNLEGLEVHFIDVGQADSILIKTKDSAMLIDAGNNDDASLIKNYLTKQNIQKIDYLVGTHPHEDHIGSLDTVINNFDIGTVIMPNHISTSKTFEDVVTALENKNLTITAPKVGEEYKLNDATFTILSPAKDYGNNTNDYSVVIRLTYGNNSFLFTGDAETEVENDILNSGLTVKADLLKMGHHGSSTSSSDKFLNAVSPKYAIITCGENNSYGHPHQETLQKIATRNIEAYRTDINGTIIATSDGNNITIKTQKEGIGEYSDENIISDSESEENIVNSSESSDYILNTNSKKFHTRDCSGVAGISEKNKESFTGSREELISKGYSACGICKP